MLSLCQTLSITCCLPLAVHLFGLVLCIYIVIYYLSFHWVVCCSAQLLQCHRHLQAQVVDQDHGSAIPAPAVKQLQHHQHHRDLEATLQEHIDFLEEDEEEPCVNSPALPKAAYGSPVGPGATAQGGETTGETLGL